LTKLSPNPDSVSNPVSVSWRRRRQSSVVWIGNTPLGGSYPVRIQSMADVSTMDTDAAVEQAIKMIKAGAEYIRFAAQGEREARNLGNIRQLLREKGYQIPLVADIHFNPHVADVAAGLVEKVRINPGNYLDKAKTFQPIDYTDEAYAAEIHKLRERFIPFLEHCRRNHTAIRIGVNHGSLSDRIMSRYGDTSEGMVESCMEFLRLCKETAFDNVVISIKASNTVLMVRTVRLLVQVMLTEGMYYPLHLGVTEAGDDEDGRIKSAVGIGSLLIDGIGDTIRVSLSEPPENELPVARKLVDYIIEHQNNDVRAGQISPLHTLRLRSVCSGRNDDVSRRHCEERSNPEIINPFDFHHPVRMAGNIGGKHPPVVISGRRSGNFTTDPLNKPDYFYVGSTDSFITQEGGGRGLIDIDHWQNRPDTYPYFYVRDMEKLKTTTSDIKFLELTYPELDDTLLQILKQDPAIVVVLASEPVDCIPATRCFVSRLIDAGCDVPVIIRCDYRETDHENLQIKAAVDFGVLLIDGIGNGLFLCNEQTDPCLTDRMMFSILQATRRRISKPEYISCPGCGRTLYDLQTTIARIKNATSHLKGLKIGIMGCIVNGPGEMADADYGYVGAGKGRISLYKGKTCVLKNIPEEDAVEHLVGLIKAHGDW